jgi:hypothetical protein
MSIGFAYRCEISDVHDPIATLRDNLGHQGPTQPGFVDYGSVVRGGHTDAAVLPDLQDVISRPEVAMSRVRASVTQDCVR